METPLSSSFVLDRRPINRSFADPTERKAYLWPEHNSIGTKVFVAGLQSCPDPPFSRFA